MRPQFIFNQAHSGVTAYGVERRFESVDCALEFADRGEYPLVGAMPFHPQDTAALFIPSTITLADGPYLAASERDDKSRKQASQPQLANRLLHTNYLPSWDEHAGRVARLVEQIRSSELEKIVASRREVYQFADAINPYQVFSRLANNSTEYYSHFVDLGGDEFFLGNSPEVLIRKTGAIISSFPLAGSVRREKDPYKDQQLARELEHSSKDHHEHAFVTEGIRDTLAPMCKTLTVPTKPSLMSTSHTWHLGTQILGELHDPTVSVVDLARMLHPTAAVNGAPSELAQSILATEEPSRGLYAGAVGWANAAGDGEWRVAIRSAMIAGDTAIAYAGGGIVADSDPHKELEETRFKLGPIRAALGITTAQQPRNTELTGVQD